jgi:hypothetical protein
MLNEAPASIYLSTLSPLLAAGVELPSSRRRLDARIAAARLTPVLKVV